LNLVTDPALDEKEKLVCLESKVTKRLREKGLVSSPKGCFYTPAG